VRQCTADAISVNRPALPPPPYRQASNSTLQHGVYAEMMHLCKDPKSFFPWPQANSAEKSVNSERSKRKERDDKHRGNVLPRSQVLSFWKHS